MASAAAGGAGAGAMPAGSPPRMSPTPTSFYADGEPESAPRRRVVRLDGNSLTPEELMSVGPASTTEARLSPAAWERVQAGRTRLEGAIAEGKVLYGVNTGFGRHANIIIPPEKLAELQLNLIRSHAAGMGEPLPPSQVKRLLLLRINVLAKGHSGIRAENVQRMLDCFNKDLLSYVPRLGSVGASGDLAPLAHLALGMLGEGRMWNPTSQRFEPAAEVLAEHGVAPIRLHMKEGLAMINGTQFITSLTAEALWRAEQLAVQADIISAVSMEALRCTTAPFDVRVHVARGHGGQISVARRLRSLLHREGGHGKSSEIFTRSKHNVQDAYSIRCVPQVHGVVHDTIAFVRTIIEQELNAATDNPMIFDNGDVVGAGNFHGEYPAKAADYLAIAVSELATMSERRIERLMNQDLNAPKPADGDRPASLPAFLVREGGLNSGFMIPHCTAAALVVENRTLVHPTSCDSISTSAAQEDHVSMGAFAARKVLNVVENVERVVAIELMAACQAIDFLRPLRSTAPIESVIAAVRAKVPFWDKDRYAAPDMNAVFKLVRSGTVLRAADPAAGPAWGDLIRTRSVSGASDGKPDAAAAAATAAALAAIASTASEVADGEGDGSDDDAVVSGGAGGSGAAATAASPSGAGRGRVQFTEAAALHSPATHSRHPTAGAPPEPADGIAATAAASGRPVDEGPPPSIYSREQLLLWERLLLELCDGLPATVDGLPPPVEGGRDPSVPHAPKRSYVSTKATMEERRLALKNALRYFKPELHAELAPEFLHELEEYGHIYMYRFRPTTFEMRAYPISVYPARCKQAAALMLMIMNNLDKAVAQFPHELVTYGGNGSVFSNWAQWRLVMKYLSEMSEKQTLVLYSGHPMGLYPSHIDAPRAVITNGMVVPNYSGRSDYERMYMCGVSQYGQMTAGSYCYIGPQGIVHGTTITVLNAGRKYLHLDSLAGKCFVTAGLGGMSGAQAKAAVICGAVGVIAEVDEAALNKRHAQGWVIEKTGDLDELVAMIKAARAAGKATSIAYHGNVVDVWRRLADHADATGEMLAELGSDQTSCHNPFGGGYYPYQLGFEEAKAVMVADPPRFKELVQASLREQVAAINRLAAKGLRFWDYGNSFLLEASRAGAAVKPLEADEAAVAPAPAAAGGDARGSDGSGADTDDEDGRDFEDDDGDAKAHMFRYPSYVEDIMGDVFSLGFGPFRWVCTSGEPADLEMTDRIAASAVAELRDSATGKHAARVRQHYADNHLWITQAGEHKLVVGSQARILYSDYEGRAAIAVAFNRAVRDGRLTGPVVISRDHHDVSGTDSPWRETANVRDGSMFCADMAVQNCIGDSFRGATWVALHNGGGTGWGEAMNGGFGMVLDGTLNAERRAEGMLLWDVYNGVSRRAWAGNGNAKFTVGREMAHNTDIRVTWPHRADAATLDKAMAASSIPAGGAGAAGGADGAGSA